jgi:hypothetical protein
MHIQKQQTLRKKLIPGCAESGSAAPGAFSPTTALTTVLATSFPFLPTRLPSHTGKDGAAASNCALLKLTGAADDDATAATAPETAIAMAKSSQKQCTFASSVTPPANQTPDHLDFQPTN